MKTIRLFIIQTLVLASTACGINFSGTYKGTVAGTQSGVTYTGTTTVSVAQDKETLSGTYSCTVGSSTTTGTISGTANGNKADPFTFKWLCSDLMLLKSLA